MSRRPGGPSAEFFDEAYRRGAPWDVGKAQQELLALFEEHPPTGPALDVGCGSGDLVFALAERGLAVVGVDLAEGAIQQARAKTLQRSPEVARLVEFRVADGLRVTHTPEPFQAVTDCGFYHVFGPDEREEFVKQLAAKLPVGGRYYLLGLAMDLPMPNAPLRVREEELRMLFSEAQGWRILTLRSAQFVTTLGNLPSIAACIERTDHRSH